MEIINNFRKNFNTLKEKTTKTASKFPDGYKTAERIDECFRSVWTTYYQRHNSPDEIKDKKSALLCHNKFCSVCSTLRASKWRKATAERVDKLKQEEKQRFLFLTLTVKNCELEDLSCTIKSMNEGWNRLWKNTLINRMNGFLKVLEITFDGQGNAHPHFHILISVDNSYFKDRFEIDFLIKAWGRALKVDYLPTVDIRAVKGNQRQIDKSLKELLKYTMKHSDFDKLKADEMVMLDEQLHAKRFIASGGNMKMSLKKIEEDLANELEDFSSDEWNEIGTIIFNYLNGAGYIPVSIRFIDKSVQSTLESEREAILSALRGKPPS